MKRQGIEGLVIRADGPVLRKNGLLAHGAEKFMRRSRERAGKLGMVSVRPTFRDSDLHRRPDLMALVDAWRIDPAEEEDMSLIDAYRGISDPMGLVPSSVLVVEHSPDGVQAAKDAGCYVLALATHFRYSQLKHAHDVAGGFAAATRKISSLAAAARWRPAALENETVNLGPIPAIATPLDLRATPHPSQLVRHRGALYVAPGQHS